MRIPHEQQALRQVTIRLVELLGVAAADTNQRQDRRAPAADAVIEIAGTTFVVDYKSSGSTAPISVALEQVLAHATAIGPRAVPLVPFRSWARSVVGGAKMLKSPGWI